MTNSKKIVPRKHYRQVPVLYLASYVAFCFILLYNKYSNRKNIIINIEINDIKVCGQSMI